MKKKHQKRGKVKCKKVKAEEVVLSQKETQNVIDNGKTNQAQGSIITANLSPEL